MSTIEMPAATVPAGRHDRSASPIIIDHHHNGPPVSGHGGVAAGRMAELVDPDRAIVRFKSPIPLGEPLTGLTVADGAVDVLAGSEPIATVTPTDGLDVDRFDPVSHRDVDRASRRWLETMGGTHPFPTCFACGSRRAHDGLCLRPGPVDGRDLFACHWTPLTTGTVPSWLAWAAIDCPTGFPALAVLDPGLVVLTGELAVEVRRPVVGGRRYQILSRLVSRSGRLFSTQAAIVDGRGRNVAVAAATWISLDGESMGAA